MANPFLVLGGIAISVATAAFGILQVPGWVAAAQDASAVNNVTMIAQAQAAQLSHHGKAARTVDGLRASSGVEVTLGADAKTAVAANPAMDTWVAISRSKSGTYFARTGESSKVGSGANAEAAVVSAGETISGPLGARVTSRGVVIPVAQMYGEVAYENIFPNPDTAVNALGLTSFWGSEGVTGDTSVVDAVAGWTHSKRAVRHTWPATSTSDKSAHFHMTVGKWLEPGKKYTFLYEYVGSGTVSTPGLMLGYPHNGWPEARGTTLPAGGANVGSAVQRSWATFQFGDTIDPNWQVYFVVTMAPGGWFERGNVQMYEGDYDPARPFVSGARAAGGLETAWLGEPNNSASIAYR